MIIKRKKYEILFCFCLLLFLVLQPAICAYAANITYYNYNTKKNVTYTGKQLTYFYNNKKVNLSYPGFMIDGIALADCKELFSDELGLSVSTDDKTITISDGINELVLTAGSKTAKLNGTSKTLSIAPIKLKFEDNIIRYYVPTRYVTEAFGLNYIYDSKTASIRITKTFSFLVNGKNYLYSNTLFYMSYKDNIISTSYPSLYWKKHVYVPAAKVSEALGCLYEIDYGSIIIKKDDITITLELNSLNASVNGHLFTMECAPVEITFHESADAQIYIPFEFVMDMLGYQFTYDDISCTYHLSDTEYTGKALEHPKLSGFYQSVVVHDEQLPVSTYFVWDSESKEVSDNKTLTKVVAYSINNADVLELYGIKRADINDFMDNRALIFEMNSVISTMGTKFYSDFDVPHLNYTLLTSLGNGTKMFFMIPLEDEWYFVETEECVKVYFKQADLSVDDLMISSEQIIEVFDSYHEPEVDLEYPGDLFVIPLPEMYNSNNVNIQDNYLDKRIQINITGDHTKYFLENPVRNPYDFVNNVTIKYDTANNVTIVTCSTDYICGFEVIYQDNYIALHLDKPSKIYDKIIVLDPGHGGKDPGAVNGTTNEKTLNLSIILQVEELLQNTDIKVYCTRTGNKFISLENRAAFAKSVQADLFISLHMNASTVTSVNGTEVFYSSDNNTAIASGLKSSKLAQVLVKNISGAIDTKSRGITNSGFYVIKHNSVPAVLIELGFITNSKDFNKLTDKTYQNKAANAIYKSIIEIFSAYPTGRY